MDKFTVSAFADEYADSFDEQLTGLQSLGIRGIELRFVDGKNIADLTPAEVAQVRRKLDAYGIIPTAIGSPLGKIPLDGDLDTHADKARRVYETAQALGVRFIRTFSFYPPEGQMLHNDKGAVLDAVGRLVRAAEGYPVTLCHENEARIYGESPARCQELLIHFNGALRCVFDMGNFVLGGYDPWEAYALLNEHIAYFHIKDALYAGAVVPPAKGEARIRAILTAYAAAHPHTTVSLEPHLETFSGWNAMVGKSFHNPYKFSDRQTAFAYAAKELKQILEEMA